MRVAFATALFAVLTTGIVGTTQAADLPAKSHAPVHRAPVAAPAKASSKVVVKPTWAKPAVAKSTAKPQVKTAAVRRAVPAAVAPAADVLKTPVVAPSATSEIITYSGIVLGPNELALPGACVFVAGDRSNMVVTNAQGEFALALPAAKTGTLMVSYGGLNEAQVSMATVNHTAVFVTLAKK